MRCKSSVSNSMLMELSSHLARKGSIDKGLWLYSVLELVNNTSKNPLLPPNPYTSEQRRQKIKFSWSLVSQISRPAGCVRLPVKVAVSRFRIPGSHILWADNDRLWEQRVVAWEGHNYGEGGVVWVGCDDLSCSVRCWLRKRRYSFRTLSIGSGPVLPALNKTSQQVGVKLTIESCSLWRPSIFLYKPMPLKLYAHTHIERILSQAE